MVRAIASLLQDNLELLNIEALNSHSLELVLGDCNLELERDFFINPKQSRTTEVIESWFRQLLESMVQKPIEAQMMSLRLPGYLLFALHEEWLENSSQYAALTDTRDIPAASSALREEDWARYAAWLQKQVEEPMFLEAFSLKQVYVPLCAYHNCYSEEPNSQRGWDEDQKGDGAKVVVDLEAELDSWLATERPRDAIRLISGAPGSGKSSFMKMWAAKVAETASIRVLYIPLHQFDIEGDLVEAVDNFVSSSRYLRHNPLSEEGESQLLIIFDGLDKLAMGPKADRESARSFLRKINRKIVNIDLNNRKTRLHVLVGGRDVAVQAISSKFCQEQRVLHLLPYFVPEEERGRYVDSRQLLEGDRRDEWWEKYAAASGSPYNKLPDELNRDDLRAITSQPLLNYLAALSYAGGRLDFLAQTNLNQLYADLMRTIYERVWADERQHARMQGMHLEQFELVWGEVALSTWHGDGRTTTVREIEKRCQSSGLKQFIASSQDGAETVVTRLLPAFYFRQSSGFGDGEKTYEFTHKSFGEYLTARRIVREIELIERRIRQKQSDPDRGWDEREALTAWANLCGATAIDEYLFRFITDGVNLRYRYSPDLVCQWQEMLCKLIGFMLRCGMPMERLEPRLDYNEESRRSRNAEEALLAVLNACARSTQQVSKIDWHTPGAFGTWIARLQGQRVSWESSLPSLCLSYLNLEGCNLVARDFWGANLQETRFQYADLQGANLQKANLVDAKFQGANLQGANLQGVDLQHANLVGAEFQGANLQGANLVRKNLQMANLQGANLQGANLQGAYLRRAKLKGVNLQGANLQGAHLYATNLEEADLRGVNLEGLSLYFVCLNGILWDESTQFQSAINLDRAFDAPREWSGE